MPDDIADLVRTEHERIRELFTLLRPEEAHDPDALRQAWTEVADLLQVHLDAAEEIGCPPVLARADSIPRRRAEMTADHGDIRDAVYAARFHPVASRGWRLAVGTAQAAAMRHIDLFDTTLLDQIRHHLSQRARKELGRQWRAFAVARALDAGEEREHDD